MAGTNPSFDSTAFRNGIKFAMQMGAPETSSERAAFHMPTVVTWNKGVDDDNLPFDPTATATRTSPASVTVDCAIEFHAPSVEESPFGSLTPGQVSITLLDVDYAQVVGFEYVMIRGQKYIYSHTDPSVGLFDVTVYTVHALAETET